jgi:hypothetical protein
MNPQAALAWNFALAKLESARRLVENDEGEPAKTELAKAVFIGAGALYYLLGPGPEEQAAHQAAQGFISEMASEEISALDALLAARRILGYIADISPPEDRLPPP